MSRPPNPSESTSRTSPNVLPEPAPPSTELLDNKLARDRNTDRLLEAWAFLERENALGSSTDQRKE